MQMKGIELLCCCVCLCSMAHSQAKFDLYISNSGNDLNTGVSADAPKKSITNSVNSIKNIAAANGNIKIGFAGANVFNETFKPDFAVGAGSYIFKNTQKDFAVFNGTEVFDSGWVKTAGAGTVYQQAIPLSGFTGYGINNVGQYSMMYVFEIDRQLEKTAPITARKLLTFVKTLQLAQATPGSFYEPVTTVENPKKIYIHTSNDNSPNNNQKYRYEVTVRDFAINSTYNTGNSFENLWIRGYGAGLGMAPAGSNSTFNHMIFGPGAGIHHLVLRGATISNSLFLHSAKNTSEFAVVFYDREGYRRHNKIAQSIFLDVRDPVYTHTSGRGSRFAAIELNNVTAFADINNRAGFIGTANTDSILISGVYADKFLMGCHTGDASFLSIKKSIFNDVAGGINFGFKACRAVIENVFLKTKSTGGVNGIVLSENVHMDLNNAVIYLSGSAVNSNAVVGSFISGTAIKNNKVSASQNIFICDLPETNGAYIASTGNSGEDIWQNNVYILLRGNGMWWQSYKTGANPILLKTFNEWKKASGQDQHSLFFDLRNDPRGLKAIFVDPENGDYALTNTFEGRQVKALKAGMTSPLSCFLQKPSYEAAANMIKEGYTLNANSCRNPCVQRNIRGSSQLAAMVLNERKIKLSWMLEDEQNVAWYDIQRSFGSSDFISIGKIKPGNGGVHSFTDSTVQPGVEYHYSLAVVAASGDKCFSEIKSAKLAAGKKLLLYPNPSAGKVQFILNDYEGPVSVNVINTLGHIAHTYTASVHSGIPVQINLAQLPKGLYLVKIITDNDTAVQSVLLK